MIFTHIFHYLDDRDAAETAPPRTVSTNDNSPSIKSRFHSSTARRHTDVRLNQMTFAAPAAARTSALRRARQDCLSQGFCSLRARSRPSPNQRVLPPIGDLTISGEERKLHDVEQNSNKLPPIGAKVGRTQNTVNHNRPRSRRNQRESAMTSGSFATNFEQTNQLMVPCYLTRFCEECATSKCYGSADATRDCNENVEWRREAENLTTENLFTDKQEELKTPKVDKRNKEILQARVETDLCKKIDRQKLRNSTQEVFSEGDITELKRTDIIDVAKEETDYALGQLGNAKEKLLRKAEDNLRTIIKDRDIKNRLGYGEANLSNGQNIEYGNSRCQTSNECLQWLGNNEAASAQTLRNGSTDFSLSAEERQRRNAVCEVLEKTTTPAYGCSLYEMRQNLIILTKEKNSFVRILKPR